MQVNGESYASRQTVVRSRRRAGPPPEAQEFAVNLLIITIVHERTCTCKHSHRALLASREKE